MFVIRLCSHSHLVLSVGELLVLIQSIVSVVPGVTSLRERHDVVGDGVFLGATSLVVQVDPSGWSCAGVFLCHYEMECDEAAFVKHIRGGWSW